MAWEIDPFYSLVEFSVKHLMISIVKGRFTEVRGTVHLDPLKPERCAVQAQVKTASVFTGVPQRDAHLRSADFFDANKYPTITFASTQVKLIDANRCNLDGNLSLHGVTKPISLHTIYTGQNQDPMTNAWRVGLYGTTTIDRRDFGMTYTDGKAGVSVVGYDIRIDITIEAVQMG